MNIVDARVEDYCRAKSTLPEPVCDEIEAFTRQNVEMPQMLTGRLEASLLGFLIRCLKARRILEIGTFTGYSALAMASHLPEDGELVTLDLSKERVDIARRFWAKSAHAPKISPVIGPAAESLKGLQGSFDLVFIDADKESYPDYLNQSLDLLSPKGVVVVDNCLWSGRVLEPDAADLETKNIRQLNEFVAAHDGLYATLLPVRDGIYLIQKYG